MKTSTGRVFRGAGVLGVIALLSVSAFGQMTYTLNTYERGWYDYFGYHYAPSDNYFTGWGYHVLHRSFFAFDRSSVEGTVLSADLRLFLPENDYDSPDPTENLYISKLDYYSADQVTSGDLFDLGIYEDLGNGDLFGDVTVSEADEGTFINITLNDTFLAYINGLSDKLVLGGSLAEIDIAEPDEVLFGSTGHPGPSTGNPADGLTQLILRTDFDGSPFTPVPEPSTYGLIGAGALLGLVALRRRKRSA